MMRKAKEMGVDIYLCDVIIWKNYLMRWFYKNIFLTTYESHTCEFHKYLLKWGWLKCLGISPSHFAPIFFFFPLFWHYVGMCNLASLLQGANVLSSTVNFCHAKVNTIHLRGKNSSNFVTFSSTIFLTAMQYTCRDNFLVERGRLSFQCGITKLPKVPTWSSPWPLKPN